VPKQKLQFLSMGVIYGMAARTGASAFFLNCIVVLHLCSRSVLTSSLLHPVMFVKNINLEQ